MHLSIELTRSHHWDRTLIVLAVIVALGGASALAQAASPKYDVHTETKLKGSVEELKLPPKGSEKEVAHLMVKNGAETVDVYLCPQGFLQDMGASLNKGDEITLTGSKVTHGGTQLILARELVKGTDTLVLRDDKGNPVWNWRH